MSARRGQRTRAHRRQRGAIQILSVAGLSSAFLAAALAVDLGRISWERRELQNIADLAALDALRDYGACTPAGGDPVAAAQASAVRNGYEGDLSQMPNSVTTGRIDTLDGVREFTPSADPADATAVRVFATSSVPATLLAGAFLPGQTDLSAVGVADRRAIAGVRAGSFLARVDTDNLPVVNDLVGELIGGEVDLDVASYEGLIGADLTVGDLIDAHTGVGTVDELLALDVTATEYFEMVATALSNTGQPGAAATLNEFALLADPDLDLVVGDLLQITPDADGAALGAVVNAWDMVNLGAQVAQEDTALMVDPLSIAVPGIASTRLKMRMIEPPRIAIGPAGQNALGEWMTQVWTSQTRLVFEIELLGTLGMLGSNPVSVDLFVEIAPTEVHLLTIRCADAADPVHRATVEAVPGIGRLGIGRFPDFETSIDPVPTELVQLDALFPVARVTAMADVPFASLGGSLEFDGPFPPDIPEPLPEHTQTAGTPLGDALASVAVSLLAETELEVELLGGLPLPIAESVVLDALNGLLTPALDLLIPALEPVFGVLGANVGGTDVTLFTLRADQPMLVR